MYRRGDTAWSPVFFRFFIYCIKFPQTETISFGRRRFMLKKWIKKINGLKKNGCETAEDTKKTAISKNLEKNIEALRTLTGNSNDIVIRQFSAGGRAAAVIYTDGLSDSDIIEGSIIKMLMYGTQTKEIRTAQDIAEQLIVASEVKRAETLEEIAAGFLSADAALLCDGFQTGFIINAKGFEKRSVDTPQTDSVIRGAREAFIENMRTNTALIRRRIKSPTLTAEGMKAGRKTKSDITLMYLRDVVNPNLPKLIKERISKMDIDGILDSGYIQQFLEDNQKSVFSTVGSTEKPDIAAAKILEGRVAVIVDGSPFVLTAPMYFEESFQSPEDYYIHPVSATLQRIIRYLSFFISILALPGYVALTSFHHEMIPMNLLFTMAEANAGTPFPSIVDAFLMIVVFEILKEAGVRLPKPVGQAVSIVGALVIGETAVSAGLIGAPMVIAVAITAVTAFATPNLTNAIVVIRYILLFLAAFMGGFGITLGLLALFVHLSSLKSFGTPFLAPFVPVRLGDLKDSVWRVPLRLMLTRPEKLSKTNPVRQKYSAPPEVNGDEKN